MHLSLRRLYFFYNRILNSYLLPPLEVLLTKNLEDSSHSLNPVFIIGAPRCGSTLVMQVFSDAFKFGYINNKLRDWFGAPGIYEKFFRSFKKKTPSDYRSVHGETSKMTDPAECGAWWYRFFRREPAYVRSKDTTKKEMHAFRRSIIGLQKGCGYPLVFKNLYAGLRLEPIAEFLPEAIFVVIERDLVDNAQSILRGRHDALNSYDYWWSVPPPDVEWLSKLPPVQQVVGQIDSIYRLIDADIRRLGLEERTFRIRYEEFCTDVHGVLDSFEVFMANLGFALDHRFKVPEQFKIDSSIKLPKAMYDELVARVTDLHVKQNRTDVQS